MRWQKTGGCEVLSHSGGGVLEKKETPCTRLPAYWLISKRKRGRTEVLTISVGGEEALPVFSFEEEARLFWLFEDLGADWKVGETTVGEMRHALFGPRTQARAVVLDPLPAILGEETNLLVTLGRERFARTLGGTEPAAKAAGRNHRRCHPPAS